MVWTNSNGFIVKRRKQRRKYNAIVLLKMDLISSTLLYLIVKLFSQMSSCYLNVTEDSLESIFKLYSDNAKLSKWAVELAQIGPTCATGSH